jgi:poly(3-hydroxybutyrate) depolymerase
MARPPRAGTWIALSLAACLFAPAAVARGKAAKKPPEWSEEAGRPVLRVFEPAPMRAYLHVPELPEGKKTSLVVVLHGHGGTPTGMLGYGASIADARGEVWMACEGSGEEQTDRGPGRSWKPATDVPGILACVDAALERYPIDPRRVVLMGHSAGGTMSLLAYAGRKAGFAGVYTTAAPMTPTSAQKGARVVVTVGTRDPNFSVFPAARQAAEKTVVARLVAVEGLEHDLPDPLYSTEALTWILDARCPSEEICVPKDPSAEAPAPPGSVAAKAKGGTFRHVLKFAAGGRAARADAPSRPAARAALASLAGEWKRDAADFGDVVASASDDPVSKDLRGVVTGAVLARYGGALAQAMSRLRGGDTSAPVESDGGWHLVHRDP